MATTRQPGLKGSPRSRSGDNLDSGAPRDGRENDERAREGRSRKRPIMHPIERQSKSAATRDHDEKAARAKRKSSYPANQAVLEVRRQRLGLRIPHS